MDHKGDRAVDQRLPQFAESLQDRGRERAERVQDDDQRACLHDPGRKRKSVLRMKQHLGDRSAKRSHSERARDRDDHGIAGRRMNGAHSSLLVTGSNCRSQ